MTPTSETYAELQLVYDRFNRDLFDNQLPACLLTLQREKQTCGYFSPDRFGNREGRLIDEIALNPCLFAITPLVETLATIAHEMCHLWQKHFGEPGRGRYHNKEWGDKLESIGLMPSDTGRPGGKRTGDRMADYPIAGGRFLQVCAGLVTEDFRISWHDRFPPSMVMPAVNHGAAQGLPAAALPLASDEGVRMSIPPPAAPGAAGSSKSNRSKYTCACGTNVWGKPGLKIHCGHCAGAFVDFEEPSVAAVGHEGSALIAATARELHNTG